MPHSGSLSHHRYSPSRRVKAVPDPALANLALEALCDAVPTGAIALDANCRVVFSNREGLTLLDRWHGRRASVKRWRTRHVSVPPEIIGACERLKGRSDGSARSRPRFGGRLYLQHGRSHNLSAVVALERSPRDRRVAIFCVLIQDRLNQNVGGGRKDHLAMLTIAERRVAKLVAEGMRNGEIAMTLGKSVTTVKTQLSAVYSKLQVRSRTELATLLRSL